MHGRAAPAAGRLPVLIYRDHLLRFSEIWVRSQGESLAGFQAYYAGSKRWPDVEMPRERCFVLNTGSFIGRAEEGMFKVLGWAPRFRRWIRDIDPVLIHAHFGVDGMLLAPVARALGVPLVVTFHGYEVTMRDEYAARSFYLHRKYLSRRRALTEDGALFIGVSKYMRDALVAQGFPADRTVAHYIGIDTARFTPDPTVIRENIVLFVGRFDGLKGGAYAIRAMAEVQRQIPEAMLVMIGDGPARAELESLARETMRNCRFLGFQPQSAVKDWLNRAKVLCGPSITIESGQCEAFGLAFLEAQAMGVPVVSFASGGIPEAVAHGVSGFLAQERNWQVLAAYIIRLLTEPDLWHRMSRAGYDRVRRGFDLSAQTRILEDLYRMALRDYAGAGTRVRAATAPK